MEVKGGYAVVDGVWVNGTGPYRMLVDTGAESVSLRPGLAAGAGLRARYAVEVESVSGITVVPVAAAERVAVGGATVEGVVVEGVEVLLAEPPGVRGIGKLDGVVGQSYLGRVNYWMDYGRGRLTVSREEMCLEGERLEMEVENGRPVVEVKLGRERRGMVVDTGASDVILFGWEGETAGVAWLRTAARESRAEVVKLERVEVGGRVWRGVRAGVVAGRRAGGLLPGRLLGSFYVNNARRWVLLEPRVSWGCASGRE